jgi:hypothetical protein
MGHLIATAPTTISTTSTTATNTRHDNGNLGDYRRHQRGMVIIYQFHRKSVRSGGHSQPDTSGRSRSHIATGSGNRWLTGCSWSRNVKEIMDVSLACHVWLSQFAYQREVGYLNIHRDAACR